MNRRRGCERFGVVPMGMRGGALIAIVLFGGSACSAQPTPAAEGPSSGTQTTPTPPEETCNLGAPAGLASCVDRTRYADALTMIASARPPGSDHHRRVAERCAAEFAASGFEVERQDYGTGENIIGVKRGAVPERVLVSAHYDSVWSCPGADDNASGVAGVLEVARVLGPASFERTLVVACWDEEERGLIGSREYVALAVERGEAPLIQTAIVFEMIGYRSSVPDSQKTPPGFFLMFPHVYEDLVAGSFRGDFVALIHDSRAKDWASAFVDHASQADLPAILVSVEHSDKNSAIFGHLRRSDHARFWERDIPSVMVTDTADFRNPNYHCDAAPDSVGDLDLDFASQIVSSTVYATATMLKVMPR